MGDVLSRVAACIVSVAFFYLGTFKLLGALQQSGYQNKKFMRWLKRKDNLFYNRLAIWALLSLLSTGFCSIVFSFAGEKIALPISAIPFLALCVFFLYSDRKYALKLPVHRTGRVKRVSAVYIFLIACVSYLVIALLAFFKALVDKPLYGFFAYLPFCLMPLILPVLLWLANAVSSPFENRRNRKFAARAGQVLKETKILRVAVVGSYAKTSVKNLLKDILSVKYAVVATPESYNTPVGIAKTVFSEEFKDKEVFIAEMGARKIGDIAELCELVEPDFAVFTGVCAQHIESFGSMENVLKAKSEVIPRTKTKVVLGEGLQGQVSRDDKCVFASGLLSDIRLDALGATFTLHLGGEEFPVKTKLLGAHAAENIALAALTAFLMGLTVEEIKQGIEKIKPIPHRLECTEANGVYILDDSYNANEKSAAAAIEALKRFSGRKIAVTPGLVETGILEEQLNGELGKELVGLDEVILVGETLVGAVKAGYLSGGGDKEKLFTVPTLERAKELLSGELAEGDAVLFLNDLPDVY